MGTELGEQLAVQWVWELGGLLVLALVDLLVQELDGQLALELVKGWDEVSALELDAKLALGLVKELDDPLARE